MTTLFVGSFTPVIGGKGAGLSTIDVDLDVQSGRASFMRRADVTAGCPTFAAVHPSERMLYVVSEAPVGEIYTFHVSENLDLEFVDVVPTAPSPAHIAVGRVGESLFAVTSHYFGGCFAVNRVLPDGTLSEPLDIIDRNRMGGALEGRLSHAHSAYFVESGGYVLAADLGHDQVLSYSIDEQTGKLTELTALNTPRGAGPRHMALHRDGRVFVSGELEGSVMTIVATEGGRSLRMTDRRSALTDGSTFGPGVAPNIPAEIALSHEDRFLHVANRKINMISTFSTDNGRLTPICDTPTGGRTPRFFTVDGDILYVGNQETGTLNVFRIDPSTGIPSPLDGSAPVAAIAYLRRADAWPTGSALAN
jgi:6-phosphogluconolactonase